MATRRQVTAKYSEQVEARRRQRNEEEEGTTVATATKTQDATDAQATERPEATEAAKVDTQVDTQVARDLARRLVALRKDHALSREVVSRLLGGTLTPAKVWRIEQERVHLDEAAYVAERLAEIDRDGVPAEYQKATKTAAPTKADLARRLDAVTKELTHARETNKLAALRDAVDVALKIIAGDGERPTEAPTTDTAGEPSGEDA